MTDPKEFTDVIYELRDRAAWIIINRPKVYNAFRARTLDELIHAFQLAANDRNISSIVLTGAGEKAFCTGGDQSAHEGQYDGRGVVGLPIEEIQGLIRDVPGPTNTPMMAAVLGEGEHAVKWKDAMVRGIPLKRMGEPDDYGGIVAMLASDDGKFITGQTISVSGGMNMI